MDHPQEVPDVTPNYISVREGSAPAILGSPGNSGRFRAEVPRGLTAGTSGE